MNEPYERCRVARLCEYARRLDAVEWTERLEFWQVAPDRVLLSAVQVLPEDLGTHEVWLSAEARSATELESAFDDWTRARAAPRETAVVATRRIAAVLARWQPALDGLSAGGLFAEPETPVAGDRSAASR